MVPYLFADRAQEAEFLWRYAADRQQHDYSLLRYGTMLVLGVGLRPLLDRQWSAVAICLLEGALLAALTVAARSDGAAYLRHRSLLLTLLSLEHFALSRLISPTVVSPGCPHPLLSLLREINLSQLPWSALISLSLPIPVRHAAVAQTLLVGLSIAWLPSLRAKSFSLCAASEGHYRSAANVLATAAACVLPPPLGAVVLAQAQRLESAAFYAVHVMAQVAVNCGLVLSVLFSWELRQRRTFARQRRLAADAAALVRLQRNSTLSLPLLVLAGAVLWAAVTALLAGRPSLV